MRVLELYSGIGGMHLAFKASGLDGEIVTSMDINTVANSIYKHNFPEVNLLHRNIQGLTPKFVNQLRADTILMSPPCQPFTRNGLQGDVDDERTKSFKHILEILPALEGIRSILVENVKGFEGSAMRNLMLEAFDKAGFACREFILSPSQIGVPNSRHRYYCLAKKLPETFSFPGGTLLEHLPNSTNSSGTEECFRISDILEEGIDLEPYLLTEKVLRKYAYILDICYRDSRQSCCFTKAYTRYLEGTGSVFTDLSRKEAKAVFEEALTYSVDSDEYFQTLSRLGLRFFTPREVCRLMCFPETFSFPSEATDKQKYMVLGNSINVRVVAELIKFFK